MQTRLEGIFSPTLVPFDARGEINERELRRLIRWLIDQGVHGLYPNGSTGEATRLTWEERYRIVQITCEEAAGCVPVIAGAAEPNVRETLKACHQYADLGVRAVAVFPPSYYRVTQDSVYAYFAEIAQQSPLDILLYNIPAFVTPIDPQTFTRLAEFSRVVAIKDSSGDLPAMMRMISSVRPLRPDLAFFTGWEAVLVPMLLIGCDGATAASSNVIPKYLKELFDLVRSGNTTEAIRRQYQFLPLFDALLQNSEFPDGFRAGAELQGFTFGATPQPLSATQLEQRKVQKLKIAELLRHMTDLAPEGRNSSHRDSL